MKINDCLKLIQKTSAIVILSAMFGIAGCGAVESDAGKAASVSSADVEHEGSVSEDTAHEGKGLSYLAYKTSEERQMQESPLMTEYSIATKEEQEEDLRNSGAIRYGAETAIPAGDYYIYWYNYTRGKLDRYNGGYNHPSNQFFKIEGTSQDDITGFVKAKGTLYTLYFYDEPAYDLTYFPGDELPEGYRVEVTPNFEKYFIGEGSAVPCMYCDLGSDGTVRYSPIYRNYKSVYDTNRPVEFDYKKIDIDSIMDQIDSTVDPDAKIRIRDCLTLSSKASENPEEGRRIELGAYGLLLDDFSSRNPFTYFIQYLTLEDLEKLPADAKLADDIVHY